jgi:hypothetical protein
MKDNNFIGIQMKINHIKLKILEPIYSDLLMIEKLNSENN